MQILSAKELSAYLRINEKKVYQLVRESKIPHVRIGGKIAFAQEIIDDWLKERTEREKHLFLAGSDDFLMQRVIAASNARQKFTVFYAPVGSMNGLDLLRQKVANLSCVHILDIEKGDYNLSYLDRYLDSGGYVVVHLFNRDQGLYLRKTGAEGVRSLSDVASRGLSFLNRNSGSGTRLLIDFLINREGVARDRINGYGREIDSHLEAGLAVLKGEADASFGMRHVAHLLDLAFAPLFVESFDLVIPEDLFKSELVEAFIGFFDQARLLQIARDFTGYDTSKTGTIIRP